MKLPEQFEKDHATVEAALHQILPSESTTPSSIHKAMRYSVFAGGKRVRPLLCIAAARIFSTKPAAAVHVGCAMELIHTYSLIHDDLPALDNDDLRRGKPTNHKVFGEAMAILAGDALLTLAFQVLAMSAVEPQRRITLLAMIAEAAGTNRGMIGGQVADIEAEGKDCDHSTLEYIHRSKTAALIRASIVAGGIVGGAERSDVTRLLTFGENIGWAFQVVDDILDVEESSATLGKTAGKDQKQKKATYPALHGMEVSKDIATELETKALKDLDAFGERAESLRTLAKFLVARRA